MLGIFLFSKDLLGTSYFQNYAVQVEWQVTDSGYGWDRSLSLFVCHKAGLYFFTFSVKADADQGDNYKYE